MKHKLLYCLVILVLVVSITSVSAASFTDLQNDIENSQGILNINQDYIYNNTTDIALNEGINLTKSNFIINGNNHTINGNNQAGLFSITGNNITIKNLNFANSTESMLIMNSNNIYLNDCTVFNSQKSIFFITNSDLTVNNFSYIGNDNLSTIFGLISSNLTLNNFSIADKKIKGSIIDSILLSSVYINNCEFSNLTSKYAPIIKSEQQCSVYIEKSKFVNINANLTAGAILFKGSENITIDKSLFINCSSGKNGGVLFSDGSEKINVINSSFFNCYSGFGGAIVTLEGKLNVTNSLFNGNTAIYNGGSIYSSYTEVNILNSEFTDNKCIGNFNRDYQKGGALYLDESEINIDNCRFIGNSAYNESAIYLYDTVECNITNSYFEKNNNAILDVFGNNIKLSNNTLNNDLIYLNQTDFKSLIYNEEIPYELINSTIIYEELPEKFDLRDYEWVTPVRNQGNKGYCWVFGICGALESALLKSTGLTFDISENTLGNMLIKYSKYGSIMMNEGGNSYLAITSLIAWLGTTDTMFDTYDEYGKLSAVIPELNDIHIQDIIKIDSRKNSTDNTPLKEALIKYGALAVSYYATNEAPYFNEKTGGHYYNNGTNANHGVTLIGWDDTYSKDNFLITPPGDGAWIIKNSWGTDSGKEGYYYISYYDTSFATSSESFGFIINNTAGYNKNYQYDIGGMAVIIKNESIEKFGNRFTSVSKDKIAAVGTYFNESGKEYTIEVYINEKLVHTQKGISKHSSFETIPLTEFIDVNKGDSFFVSIECEDIPILAFSRNHVNKNCSFMYGQGSWADLSEVSSILPGINIVIPLKVYTVPSEDSEIISSDLIKMFKNDTQFIIQVLNKTVGVADEKVVFTINGVNYTRYTDKSGFAKININLQQGEYVIITNALNLTSVNKITVLPTLVENKDLVKYYKNESQYTVKVLDKSGKAVGEGCEVTFNINGVFYTRTTDENGIAKLNINLNPGKYIITAEYEDCKVSNNITVLPTLIGKDLNMTYKDGSKYECMLVDGSGKAIEGVTLTFNVNGVFYYKTTDVDGIARLNINLNPGKYIITAEYEDCKFSNNIAVLPAEHKNSI